MIVEKYGAHNSWKLAMSEFPDYPYQHYPVMLDGFKDSSWHNDVSPCMINETKHICIWLDYVDPTQRETGYHGHRFIVTRLTKDNQHIADESAELLGTDSWDEVIAFVKAGAP